MSNAIKPEHYNRLNPQPKDVIPIEINDITDIKVMNRRA